MFVHLRIVLQSLKPFFSFAKKAFLVFITFYVVLNLFFYFANKDKIKVNPKVAEANREGLYKELNNPEYQKTDEGKIKIAIARGFMCGFVGEGCTNNPNDAKNNLHASYLGILSNITFIPISTPAASGIEWAKTGLENAGFIPQSHAAIGVGLAAVSPFKNLWVIFRNLSFTIMIVIMVAIGFMIMFRTKLGGQTVVTVENALPKIVIAMILITFSYAIAGLMIDLMYISIGLIVNIFGTNPDLVNNPGFDPGGGANQGSDAFVNHYINKVFFSDQFSLASELFENDIPSVAASIYQFIPLEIKGILNEVVSFFGLHVGLIVIGGMINTPGAITTFFGKEATNLPKVDALKGLKFITPLIKSINNGDTMVISLIASIILFILYSLAATIIGPLIVTAFIWLILMFSLFFVMMRIFFLFIGAYVKILLLIIFSPLILMMEMIPGRSAFSDWLKSLFLNLITFPLFVVIMLLSKTIMATSTTESFASPLWSPPFLWGGFDNSNTFSVIIAGALIFMAPNLIDSFKKMTGIKEMGGLDLNLSSMFQGAIALGGLPGLSTRFQKLAVDIGGVGYKDIGLRGVLGKLWGGFTGRSVKVDTGVTGATTGTGTAGGSQSVTQNPTGGPTGT